MSDETNRTPSPASTAGERQNIADDSKFQELAGDLYNAGAYNESMEKSLNALIAHINTWAGRSAGDVVPVGYVLAPAIPTPKMLDAAHLAENCGHGDKHFLNAYRAMLAAAPAADIKADAAAGAARQGGNTSESSNESCAATPTNTAPAVQPEPVDKRADAEVLRDLTKEYDTYMADRAALVMEQSFTEWKDSRMRRGQNSASNGATGEKV
jgi:hypothetical protein